jgi:hypothetical protein
LRRFGKSPVARLATIRPDGAPHVVPVVFALVSGPGGDMIYTAVTPSRSTTIPPADHPGLGALRRRHPQYGSIHPAEPLAGPLITVSVRRWSGCRSHDDALAT